MAGSPEYLELLDLIERAYTDPTHPLNTDPEPIGYDLLDVSWRAVVNDPTNQPDLMTLADVALRIYANQRGASFADVILTSKNTHIRKNAGYAGADNSDPWANFRMAEDFGITAHMGVLVRMSDKYIRIRNLRRDPNNEQVGESILDTLIDLAAYSLIAVCLLREPTATTGGTVH